MTRKCTGCFALLLCIAALPARAGADRAAAMAEVFRGESLSSQGDLEGAVRTYRQVMKDYPAEHEAKGWSRVRLSDIYWAGMQWNNGASILAPAWEDMQAGRITPTDLRFSICYQFARFLDKLALENEVLEVGRKGLAVFSEIGAPTPQQRVASGWLTFFLIKVQYAHGDFAGAMYLAEAAEEIGAEESEPALAAWSALFRARAAIETGNTLLAIQVLEGCLSDYSAQMEPDYSADVRLRLVRCQARLGLLQKAHTYASQVLLSPNVDRGLKAETLVTYADAALTQGATSEGVSALCLLTNAYRDIPNWGDTGCARLNAVSSRESGRDTLVAALDTGTMDERAAVALELARTADAEELASLLDFVEAHAVNEDLRRTYAQVRAEKTGSQQDRIAEYTDTAANSSHRTQSISAIREAEKVFGPCSDAYYSWLESLNQGVPTDQGLMHQAEFLQECRGHHEQAMELCDQVLAKPGNPEDRLFARARRIIGLHSLDRTPEARIEADLLIDDTVDPERIEYGLLRAADRIRAITDDHAFAIELLDRVILSGTDLTWKAEALFLKARSLRNRGQLAEARETLTALVSEPLTVGKNERQIAEGLLDRARMDRRTGKWGEALKAYEEILGQDAYGEPQRRIALKETIRILYETGQSERCIEACERALAGGIEKGFLLERARVIYAECLHDLGFADQAREYLADSCSELEDSDALVMRNHLLAEWRQEDAD